MKQIQLVGITSEELLNSIFKGIDARFAQLEKQFQPREPETYLTRKQTCELVGVNYTTLTNWKKKNILVPVSIGGRVLYKRSEIEAAMVRI